VVYVKEGEGIVRNVTFPAPGKSQGKA